MSTLAAWLREQLDEDERVARAAMEDDSGQDGGMEDATWLTDGRTMPRFGDALADLIRVTAVPRHVLVEVDAKRRILDQHANSGGECRTCCGEPYIEETWDGEEEHRRWTRVGLPWPCPDVLLLALPYADRTGYREEWRP